MPTKVKATLLDNIGFKVNIKEFPEFLMDEPQEFQTTSSCITQLSYNFLTNSKQVNFL